MVLSHGTPVQIRLGAQTLLNMLELKQRPES